MSVEKQFAVGSGQRARRDPESGALIMTPSETDKLKERVTELESVVEDITGRLEQLEGLVCP